MDDGRIADCRLADIGVLVVGRGGGAVLGGVNS